MDYLYLDAVSWEHSQAIYHAAAYLGREVLIILRPATPYVCIGFHQDAQQEIDLEYAKQNNIPVFRREVGGGAVYLDGQQLFFQLIVRKDNPAVPKKISDFYKILLQPIIDTFRKFGVPAEYKPVNDIIANGRKISGTGAAQIEDMMILVGNFLQDFNYEMMTRVLRVPDEKFRDKVFKTMSENLTTFKRETGVIPANDDLAADLLPRYEAIFGKMNVVTLDNELVAKADALLKEMNKPEWLLANDKRRPDASQVKIAEGIYVIQKMVKTPGGLIRVTAVNNEGILKDVHISGDFFFFPSEGLERLEETLDGIAAEASAINLVVERFYQENEVQSPGVTPMDFAQVLAAS
jgi:lipoate-protein ligase A